MAFEFIRLEIFDKSDILYSKVGAVPMSPQDYSRRLNAVKLADAVNKIEGVPVTENARRLSAQWARGEITGDDMKEALLNKHRRVAIKAKS
jgi:hypothetical protein